MIILLLFWKLELKFKVNLRGRYIFFFYCLLIFYLVKLMFGGCWCFYFHFNIYSFFIEFAWKGKIGKHKINLRFALNKQTLLSWFLLDKDNKLLILGGFCVCISLWPWHLICRDLLVPTRVVCALRLWTSSENGVCGNVNCLAVTSFYLNCF